jgi:16S rRNA processing protein RimM
LTQARVLLGAVAAAHGIRGEVKVKTFTETPQGLGAYGLVTTEDGRALEIAQLRATKRDEAVVQFVGISDRNAAESLKGERLYVPRAALPAPEDGAFYHTDLVGLRAHDASGALLGTVGAVHNFGAGDVLEIACDGGGTEFVPFDDPHVPVVDIAGGRIVVALPSDADD